MKPASKPLFIPLKTEHYEAFEKGFKTHEIRLNGKRWNRKTCFPGREVILSKGYGAGSRLPGRIKSVDVFMAAMLPADELAAFKDCYGEGRDALEVIYIGIEVGDAQIQHI